MRHPEDPLDGIRVFTPDDDDPDDDETVEPKPGLDTVIDGLLRGEYPRSSLIGLSDLSPGEARVARRVWETVAPDVRYAVVLELHDLAEERVDYLFGRFLRSILDDPDARVRQQAITGLWEESDPHLLDLLISMLQQDPSQDVRAEAARSLARYADQAELGECPPEQATRVRDALTATLVDVSESMHVRARALEAAAVFAGDATVRAEIAAFFEEEDTGFRATALYAMGRSGDTGHLATILNETASDDAELRYDAARAAGQLGETDALPSLAALAADDEDSEVRQAAIAAIGEIGGTAAARYLRRMAVNASDADLELIENALEDASLVTDPLLLDDES